MNLSQEKALTDLRVALVHDWLDTYRGGERVVEALLELYPKADIYTLFYDPKDLPPTITSKKIVYPKWLAPFKRMRKAMLPFLPTAIETFKFDNYDLIVSSSSCVAKGVKPPAGVKHICYIHSPMRYIWDQKQHYLDSLKFPPAKWMFSLLSRYLRWWDVRSAKRVDQFVANSNFIAERVRNYYGRDAVVVNPPIDYSEFEGTSGAEKEDYVLAAGAFVPYKRFDLAIDACEKLGQRLIIAGKGPEGSRLKKIAGRYTSFVDAPDRQHWIELIAKAKALVFPGVEDFGLVPIEAMAGGTPTIAYRAGGALDYIKEGETGYFFSHQSSESLAKAIGEFKDIEPSKLKNYAKEYDKEQFLRSMRKEIAKVLEKN